MLSPTVKEEETTSYDGHDDAAASIMGVDRDSRRRPKALAGEIDAGEKGMMIICW